jgi:hypothetical protein
MRDQQSLMATVAAIVPGTYADDPANITVDRSGFDALTFALSIGVGGISFTNTNRIDVVMEHSEDGTTWDPVGADNVLGATPDPNGIVLSQRTAHPGATVHRIGYVDGTAGDRPYVRLRADFAGTHATGTALSAIAILGHGRDLPAAA